MINQLKQSRRLALERKNLGLLAVAVALALALVATSCAPAQPVEEKEKVVKVGVQAIFTGAVATMGVPVGYGHLDYGKYIDGQGGLDGVKVEMAWEDTAYLLPRVLSAHKRFKQAGAVVEITPTGGSWRQCRTFS